MSEEEEPVDVKPSIGPILTPAQKAMIEKNRLKALERRAAKLIPHPYAKVDTAVAEKTIKRTAPTKIIDTGGGFLIEETEDLNAEKDVPVTQDPGPILPPDCPVCEECQKEFGDSWLLKSFNHSVCDGCRDNEDKHVLITKTDAKNEYLLKDCDLDKREPILKFIIRKNPHNPRWGDMKLYLHLQIEKRALEVWGSEEALLEERELRDDKRSAAKIKKYNKQLKALRMNVRSSLYNRTSAASHTHTYGPETYNEEDDNYTRTCTTCPYVDVFEKM